MKKIIFSISLLLTIFATNAQWIELDSLASPIVNISTSNENIYVCTAVSGVYISNDSGNTFHQSNEGLDNLNTRIILPKDSLLILGTNNSIYKSTNHGSTWELSSNGFPTNGDLSNVESIIWKGDSILVATYGNGIYCSIDLCQNWFSLNNGFTDLFRSCLLNDKNIIFTGTQYGGSGIYVSYNNGEFWTQKNNGVPTNPYAPDKYVDITSFTTYNSSTFASTYGRGILKTENNGDLWYGISCPYNYVWTIINIDNLFICGHSGGGVTISNDFGENWTITNEGLGIFDTDIRTFCKFDDYIFTGTWSRKIFKRPFSELITSTNKNYNYNLLKIYPNPITFKSIIDIPISNSEKYSFKIYDESGTCIINEPDFDNNSIILRKEDFKSGVYIFNLIVNSKKSYYGKFIVI